jgi:serine/threonine-protein kinase ULK/ATG1
MEYCALGDLSLFIKKRDSLANHRLTRDMIAKYPNPQGAGLNEVIVRHFLKQLASALQFLRSRDLIHRDVKPQNLLLNPSPKSYAKGLLQAVPYQGSEDSFTPVAGIPSLPMLKIADFGFARSLPSTSLAETLCGSPLYMAPEILRYEKYDAKADLWSVGTVLFEMLVGRPPFKAANHVELLRRIEKADDRIKFPEETEASDSMKRLIRALLKRNPVERLNFRDFFESAVVKGDIPGLAKEDLPAPPPSPSRPSTEAGITQSPRRSSYSGRAQVLADSPYAASPPDYLSMPHHGSSRPETPRPVTGATPAPVAVVRRISSREKPEDLERAAVLGRQTGTSGRPSSSGGPVDGRDHALAGAALNLQRDRIPASPGSSLLREQMRARGKRPAHEVEEDEAAAERERERERAAQDVAFERDYVVVEKRAVEVNAFADELAASPKVQQQKQRPSRNAGAIIRRATTSVAMTTGKSAAARQEIPQPSPDARLGAHRRKGSYDTRLGTSPTSAISKALNMASGRLFGVSFSPPLAITRSGRSPPMAYSPFPKYPLANVNLVVAGDPGRQVAILDEDAKAVQVIEECATRSDVVYGFAEVKYKQLIPLTPSSQPESATRPTGISPMAGGDPDDLGDGGLTDDAVVTLCEEALVLYVKALSLLAKSMDIAGAWWARKNRGEIIADGSMSRPDAAPSSVAASRINSVVQWVRNRFNEVLQKADYVRLRLVETQRRLNPQQSSNNSSGYAGYASSTDQVVVASGVTAEKLMYDRALEMSRTAAINELTGEDLPGCEIAYVTAIRMLEAVLESDEDAPVTQLHQNNSRETQDEQNELMNGMEADDREVVAKREFLLIIPFPCSSVGFSC